MQMKPPALSGIHTGRVALQLLVALLGLVVCASAWATSTQADHEARRTKFKQLCANATPSQRETLEELVPNSELDYYTSEGRLCTYLEHRYFGTERNPNARTWDTVALGGTNIRDYSPIQYFGDIKHVGLNHTVTDLSPIANYTALETLTISSGGKTVDISLIANFKNLKTLKLQDTQVESLAPLASLDKLETLNLLVFPHTGLPGRKGLDGLRHLKSLKQLNINVAEPLGDQLKDLQNLQFLTVYGPVGDVCSLAGLKKLTQLSLIKSGIRDISCLKDLKGLEAIALDYSPINSIAELAPLPNLRNLHIRETLIENLSPLTGNPKMYVIDARGTPLRWCSPKTAKDIQKGVSCFNADGTEKPWWKRVLRM